MNEKKVYRAIGLMSGTSLDGEIDVALLETDGEAYVKPLGFYTHPYEKDVRDRVRACFGKREHDAQTQEAEQLVTNLHIDAVKASGFEADLIGFHGQTITHDPAAGMTWQLGDGARMAQATGLDVVCDFRSADVAAGGQGAPLAPLYHRAITADIDVPVVVLNLGGVGNITYIMRSNTTQASCESTAHGRGLEGDTVLAFDTGPANALMDDYMVKHLGQAFDRNGALASQGMVQQGIVDRFLSDAYFVQEAPKSLDRNHWDLSVVQDVTDHKDAMATLMALSVSSVVKGIECLPEKPVYVFVCGGGSQNDFLVKTLKDRLYQGFGARIRLIEEIGYNGDAIEAEAFAYLAVRSVLGFALSDPFTTGVKKPLSGGVLHKP